jgi:hypothetical protein
MLNTNKYWKSLLGTFAEVLIAKPVDYAGTGSSAATGGTLADFVTNAVEGEFAFVNAETNAIISGAPTGSPAAIPAVASSTWIYAVVKRDGQIEKTNKFRLADYSAKKANYAAPVLQASKAVFSGSAVAGKELGVKILETTPGNQPFPTWYYSVVIKTGESLATALGRLVAIVNDNANVINKDTDPIVTAALSSTTITFTAKTAGVTFRIAFSSDALELFGAAAEYTGSGTAAASYGNGTFEQVKELEQVSDVLKGVTTQYPLQGANPEDFGKPSVFAQAGTQYAIFYLAGEKGEYSPTPVEKHIEKHQIILAIPSNGAANANAEVTAILGL